MYHSSSALQVNHILSEAECGPEASFDVAMLSLAEIKIISHIQTQSETAEYRFHPGRGVHSEAGLIGSNFADRVSETRTRIFGKWAKLHEPSLEYTKQADTAGRQIEPWAAQCVKHMNRRVDVQVSEPVGVHGVEFPLKVITQLGLEREPASEVVAGPGAKTSEIHAWLDPGEPERVCEKTDLPAVICRLLKRVLGKKAGRKADEC